MPNGKSEGEGITVEFSTPDDADSVTGVLEASYPELMKSAYDAALLRRALPAMVRANPKLLGSGTYYVARQWDGLVVGCGGWSPEKPGTAQIELGMGHIRHFAVDPRWAGRGIGRQIYQACELQALANGITALDVFASLNAVCFYAILGFSKLQDIDVAMGLAVCFPSVWMRRQI